MMSYEQWKALNPRQRAKAPAVAGGYLRPQHYVTISLDADLAAWLLENVVGRSSFTADMEETVITALRVIRGELDAGVLDAIKAQAGVSGRRRKRP